MKRRYVAFVFASVGSRPFLATRRDRCRGSETVGQGMMQVRTSLLLYGKHMPRWTYALPVARVCNI
jgi:hypothetical protein